MPAPSQVTYVTATKTSMLTELLADIDAGVSSATLQLYSEADVLLATITLDDPAGTIASGVLTVTAPSAATVATGGVCTWGRFSDSAGNAVVDVPATQGGASVSGFIVLDTTTLVQGADVTLLSCEFG